MLPEHEVFAIGQPRARRGGDTHDGPMPMDHFVWMVDIGFTAESAGAG
jgi:hypothetical protein